MQSHVHAQRHVLSVIWSNYGMSLDGAHRAVWIPEMGRLVIDGSEPPGSVLDRIFIASCLASSSTT